MPRMRAAQLVEPRRMDVVDVDMPEPADGEVRVRVEGCGVCASNIPPFEGREWFEYPMAPGDLGHEGWGVVDAVGRDVSGLAEGDRVAMLSYKAYAEYDTAAVSNVTKLPSELADVPFPAEPLACAINVFKRSRVREGDTIVIVGVGFLGALVTRLATAAGATVVATTRRSEALAFAADAGAVTEPMDDHWRVIEAVKGHVGEAGADVVIECVGKQWPLDLAGELVREHGRLVIAGYHQDGPRQVNLQQWNWKGLDVINAHERVPQTYVDDMTEAVRNVAAGKLDHRPLMTHDVPLERLGEALQMTIDRPAGFMKAWVQI
ncbi:MAG: zinc-binding dehydrogenase [Planctomycetota bacterium]